MEPAEIKKQLINLLPTIEDIEKCLADNNEALCVLRLAMQNITSDRNSESKMDNILLIIDALAERSWERIHTGYFSLVPQRVREVYALSNYLKIVLILLDDHTAEVLERWSKTLDFIKLMGYTNKCCQKLHNFLESYFKSTLSLQLELTLPRVEPLDVKLWENQRCDIPKLQRPSIEKFNKEHFMPQMPALLLDCITDWPALNKWRDLSYLQRLAGHRCVPVEQGANYIDENWSSSIVKLCDFLKRQFGTDANKDPKTIEYLAQHELFEQIPALYEDIRTPDYCMLGSNVDNISINAWLGPKGTYSPLHFDPKHNLLCQIFGAKKILLACPEDSKNLYVNETRLLANSSSIPNAECIDFERFPAAGKVNFLHVPLVEGSCLYIPPKWWHSVRAETPSFSVSFWWD